MKLNNPVKTYHILPVICLLLVINPISAQQQSESVIFFMAGHQHERVIWQVDVTNNEPEVIFDLNEQPELGVETLSPNEQSYLDVLREFAVNDPGFEIFNSETLRQYISGIWTLDASRLLVQIDHELCYPLGLSNSFQPCIGFSQFYTFDVIQHLLSSPIATIDYHHEPLINDMDCKEGPNRTYISNVNPNPQYDILFLNIGMWGYCGSRGRLDNIKPWTLLIDFRAEPATFTTLAAKTKFRWSPDGSKLAYINTYLCHDVSGDGDFCETRIEVRENEDTLVIPQLPHDAGESTTHYDVAWANNETLVYVHRKHDCALNNDPHCYELYWHSISTHDYVISPIDEYPDVPVPNVPSELVAFSGHFHGLQNDLETYHFLVYENGDIGYSDFLTEFALRPDVVELEFDPAPVFGDTTWIDYITPAQIKVS